MSSGKLKSLKLQRTSQRAESATKVQMKDTSISLSEETPGRDESREKSSERHDSPTPLHSTPKRSSGRSNATQDHAALGYRVSPILLPCTQEGVNEVAWDWESPLAKKNKRKCLNNVESTGTPKRASALQKKRSSNSPLLYKPIKRQLMKNDPQQESLEKFTAEMKALSEQIKLGALPKEATSSAARVDKEETDDELLVQIDINDFAGETKFEFSMNNDNSNRALGGDVVVLKTSLDDFFDDSIDDSMVKCSQEVEAKLKLASTSGGRMSNSDSTNGSATKDSSWHQQPYSRLLATRDRSDEAAGTSSKIVTNSASSSTARRAAVPTSETKTSSTTTKPSSSSSTVNKCYPAPQKKTSTFSLKVPAQETKSSAFSLKVPAQETKSSTFKLKVPTKETKASTFSVKFPTAETKRPNVPTIAPTSSKPSFVANNSKEDSKKSSTIGSSLDDVFEIPDDSFDDFLAVCFDDEDMTSFTEAASSKNNSDRSSSHQSKTNDPRSSTRPIVGNQLSSEGHSSRKAPFPAPQQASGFVRSTSTANSLCKAANSTVNFAKVFPRSASNDSLKPSTSAAPSPAAPPSQSSANQARKFFKSKSLSTSSFDDQTSKSSASGGSSVAKGWKTNLFINGNVSSVSTQEPKNRQCNETQGNAWPRTNGSVGNSAMYNVNRNAPRDDDNVRYKSANGSARQAGRELATGSQSTQICTPEEIERKRLEAKMKLEAKRKLMGRSTSSGALPIKR